MKLLTAIDEHGHFTGVQYSELHQNILDHHHGYGHKLVWLERVLQQDADGNVTEEPTEADLVAEVTEVPDLEAKIRELEETIDALLGVES